MYDVKTLYERGDCCLHYLVNSGRCINQLVGPVQVKCLGYSEYCSYKIDGSVIKRSKQK